jgi:MAF protein
MQNPSAPAIILASASPYRRGLLDRFLDSFETVSPDIDESNPDNLSPKKLARQLARKKAETVATAYRDALVIGADQLAVFDGQVLGKPGGHQKAVEQLVSAAGKTVTFRTAVCILDPIGRTRYEHVDTTRRPCVSVNSTAGWPRPTCATMNLTTAPAASRSRGPASCSSIRFPPTTRPH